MADLTLKKVFEFLRKVDEINISSEARDLLIHYMTHQGKDYVFHNDFIADQKGWSRQYMERYKKELVTENLIFSDFARENGKRVGTRVIVNYDFPNVIISNVSNPNVRKSNVRKPNVRKANVSSANVRKPDVLESKKINREEENRREVENLQSGPSLSERPAPPENPAPASDIPAGTQTALFPEIPAPEKASTKFIPPTKTEVRAKLEAVLTEKGTIQRWTDSDLQSFTDRFYDWYDSAHWLKNDGRMMKDWQRALSVTWLAKRDYLPERQLQTLPPSQSPAQQRQQPKSFKQQDLDYANRRFIDPAGEAIRTAVRACLSMGGNDPCDYGLPVELRERAMKLLQEERQRLAQSFNPFPELPQ
jgi:hypothetical protein